MMGVEVWMLDRPGGFWPRHPLHKISERLTKTAYNTRARMIVRENTPD